MIFFSILPRCSESTCVPPVWALQEPRPSRQDLEKLGILRPIDLVKTATILISEGKAGWRCDSSKESTDNVASLLQRYTLGQVPKPCTYKVRKVGADSESPMFQATLTTVMSDHEYVGEIAKDSLTARRAAAKVFLEAPEVTRVFEKLPPKMSDIKSKVALLEKGSYASVTVLLAPSFMRL